MGRRSGLGRGLGALLPETDAEPAQEGALTELPLSQIEVNRYQPRTVFDDEALASLTASIQELGVLQPVLVRALEDGRYELIAGERRWRAAQLAGLSSIPAVVREAPDQASLEQALVENLHREDLNPIEEAAGYQRLVDEFGLTQELVAQRVGKSRSAVANTVRLLHLPPSVQALVGDRSLSAGHARALLACEDEEEQVALAARVQREGLSVRETEEAVRRLVAARFADDDGGDVSPGATRPAALLELEGMLGDLLDTKVQVSMGARRGKVVIDFATIEDLERIYRVITEGRPDERIDT